MTGKEAVAGDIVAVNGWKDAVSGEALSAPAAPLPLDAIQAQHALLASPTAAQAPDPAPLDADLFEVVTVSCENGNFKGEAQVTYSRGDISLFAGIYQYRITRSNGQSGGNKANINIEAVGRYGNMDTSEKARSPDSMRQDGNWHSLDISAVATSQPGTMAYFEVEFVFDRSGSDPSCKTSRSVP